MLVDEKFMSERYLRKPAAFGKPGFTYCTCIPFTINKKRIQKKINEQEIQDLSERTSQRVFLARHDLQCF